MRRCQEGSESFFRGLLTASKRSIFLVFAAAIMSMPESVQAVSEPITESGPTYTTYPIATPPVLSQSGAKGVDPVFGTSIMRLTDGTDGSSNCSIQYSFWPVFNKDSTRIAVLCSLDVKRAVFFDFDPDTFTVSNRQAPDVWCLSDMTWSAVEPDIMFCRSGEKGKQLTAYNVSTGEITLVKDLSSYVITGGGIEQMSRSIDDDVWAFTLTNSSGASAGYLAWKRSTDQVLTRTLVPTSEAIEVQVDKSGMYLTGQVNSGDSRIIDLTSGAITQLDWDIDGYYHEDTGHGTVLTGCGGSLALCYRYMNDAHTEIPLVAYTSYSQYQSHYSMLADNEGWGLVTSEEGTLRSGKPCQVGLPFECEIYQAATDGSGTVRRLVHHNSTSANYDHSAFGNISRDGRFLAWTSDWGNLNGRTDVYLAEIAPAPVHVPDTTAPSAPTDAVASSVTDSRVTLGWGAAADDRRVAGYSVYRNGVEIGKSATLTYADAAVTPATVYVYTVQAFDSAGNVSVMSNEVSLTTPDAPVIVGITSSSVGTVLKNSAILNWSTNVPSTATIKYGASANKQNSTKTDDRLLADHTYTLSGLKANTTYYYKIIVAAENSTSTATSAVMSFKTTR